MQAKVILSEESISCELHVELPEAMWHNYISWKSWRKANPYASGSTEWLQFDMDAVIEEIRKQYKPENIKLSLQELNLRDILPV